MKQQRNKAVSLSVVLFVLFLTFSRSFLPPFSFVSPHVLYLFVRRGYFCFFRLLFVPLKKRDFLQRKKNKPPLVFWRLLYRQPSTSIGTSRRKSGTDFNYLFRWSFTFSVAVTRSYPFSPLRPAEKAGLRFVPGLGRLVDAATPRGAPRKKNKISAEKATILFFFCGASGCYS